MFGGFFLFYCSLSMGVEKFVVDCGFFYILIFVVELGLKLLLCEFISLISFVFDLKKLYLGYFVFFGCIQDVY